MRYEAPPPWPQLTSKHLFAAEIRLGRRAVVELDAEPVGLVGRRQRQGHRRILLIAQVEEHHVVRALSQRVKRGYQRL